MAEALKDINVAIELTPDTADFYRTRAVIHSADGRQDEAQQDWTRYKELEKRAEEKGREKK